MHDIAFTLEYNLLSWRWLVDRALSGMQANLKLQCPSTSQGVSLHTKITMA